MRSHWYSIKGVALFASGILVVILLGVYLAEYTDLKYPEASFPGIWSPPELEDSTDIQSDLLHGPLYFGDNMKDAYERMGWVKHPELEECYAQQKRPKAIHCIPKFYIICCPRSGSTNMRRLLENHPQVVIQKSSEDHYWMSYQTEKLPVGHDAEQFNWQITDPVVLKRWMEQFRLRWWKKAGIEKKKTMIWGATTPEYWYQSVPICSKQNKWRNSLCDTFTTPPYDTIPRALRYWFPKMKFIIMTRHPADRAVSHWSSFFDLLGFCGDLGYPRVYPLEPHHFQACFHQYVSQVSQRWTRCLEEYGEEECSVWPRRKWGQGDFLRSIIISFHDAHSFLWLRYFPPEQFHFVHTEQLKDNFDSEIQLFSNYVGLDRAGFVINKTRSQNKHEKPRPEMWPETRLQLEAIYRPHIVRTCKMLPQACRFVDYWYDQHIKLANGEWSCKREREDVNIWHEDCKGDFSI